MPYARPTTIKPPPITNGISSIISESRYSTVEPSTTASSMIEDKLNDDRDYSSSSTATGASEAWRQNISASFSQLSLQIQAVSQAMATIPPHAASDHQAIAALSDRLDSIEDGQRNLTHEIELLKQQYATVSQQPSSEPVPPSEPQANENKIDLEAALKEQVEAFKLEQEQLPARLQNALATKSLSPIRMPPMKNRKFPPNAPSTRGEFEHLTRERYEALMTAYDVKFSGDTNAKRETLRGFLGIPALPIDKK